MDWATNRPQLRLVTTVEVVKAGRGVQKLAEMLHRDVEITMDYVSGSSVELQATETLAAWRVESGPVSLSPKKQPYIQAVDWDAFIPF